MRLQMRQLACVLMLVASLGATASARPRSGGVLSVHALTRLLGAVGEPRREVCALAGDAYGTQARIAATPLAATAAAPAAMLPPAAQSTSVQQSTAFRRA